MSNIAPPLVANKESNEVSQSQSPDEIVNSIIAQFFSKQWMLTNIIFNSINYGRRIRNN